MPNKPIKRSPSRDSNSPAFEIVLATGETVRITGVVNFLAAVEALKDKRCKAIAGPDGGILVLNEHGCLVYNNNQKEGPYFYCESYLKPWKLLN